MSAICLGVTAFACVHGLTQSGAGPLLDASGERRKARFWGLHAIQDRPVARKGRVVVRPMMYAALTYDHRIIDGREAVLFLKQIKTLIEERAHLLQY